MTYGWRKGRGEVADCSKKRDGNDAARLSGRRRQRCLGQALSEPGAFYTDVRNDRRALSRPANRSMACDGIAADRRAPHNS
jgi:hypothetical protein